MGIEAKQGGIESLISTGVKYDLIILSHVFEHFYDPKKELTKLTSLL